MIVLYLTGRREECSWSGVVELRQDCGVLQRYVVSLVETSLKWFSVVVNFSDFLLEFVNRSVFTRLYEFQRIRNKT